MSYAKKNTTAPPKASIDRHKPTENFVGGKYDIMCLMVKFHRHPFFIYQINCIIVYKTELCRELIAFLGRWLLQHIIEADKKIVI